MSGETHGPLRVALAGCGRIAERVYLSALRRLPQISLVAAIEPSEDRRRALAALIGDASLYESIEACLASVPVDAVIVATPSTSHLSIATTAVRAGLAVLIEKPLAPGLKGVPDFEAVCRRQGSPVAIGFNRRFWRPVNDLRAALERSELPARVMRLVQFSDPQAWASISETSGPLDDLASHQFDLIRYVLRTEVASVACRLLGRCDLEYSARLENGITAKGRVAFRPGKLAEEWIAFGNYRLDLRSDRLAPASGVVRLGLDFFDAAIRLARRRRLTILESYGHQLADFASCISERRDPRATLADGIAAVRCVDAASRSAARRGTEVSL
jgi:myo-inositol 2-dehydrogenase / D-chiro-inositol 1-dehydrogenase